MFDEETFARGIALQREIFGDEAADGALARHRAAVAAGNGERSMFSTCVAWGMLFSRPQLALRDRAIVIFTADVVLGTPLAMRDHVRVALHAGVTRAEIEEILFQLTPYVGFPKVREAGVVVRELCADLDAGRPIDRRMG